MASTAAQHRASCSGAFSGILFPDRGTIIISATANGQPSRRLQQGECLEIFGGPGPGKPEWSRTNHKPPPSTNGLKAWDGRSSKVVGKTKLRRTFLWNVDILLLPAVVASRQRKGVIKNALGQLALAKLVCFWCPGLQSRSGTAENTLGATDRNNGEYIGCMCFSQWLSRQAFRFATTSPLPPFQPGYLRWVSCRKLGAHRVRRWVFRSGPQPCRFVCTWVHRQLLALPVFPADR